MLTVTIDILNNKAVKLLKELEHLQLIKMRNKKSRSKRAIDWVTKYNGAMTKQPLHEIDVQLNELRSAWE